MNEYSIIRMYAGDEPTRTIETGLTLAEAREHCSWDETSSSTCEDPENVAHTAQFGAWFDGYESEAEVK